MVMAVLVVGAAHDVLLPGAAARGSRYRSQRSRWTGAQGSADTPHSSPAWKRPLYSVRGGSPCPWAFVSGKMNDPRTQTMTPGLPLSYRGRRTRPPAALLALRT